MQILLNKPPSIAYAKEPYLALMEDGYALPIDTQGNATVLLFDNVEDHIDGNGFAVLWMLEGGGTFFHEGSPIAFKQGDVIVFDDRLEHGFEADTHCLAVNIDIGLSQDHGVNSLSAILDGFERLVAVHRTISETSPNF